MSEQQYLDNRSTPELKRSFFWIGLLFSFCCALSSFAYKYWLPDRMFWDENYHIASAYKYNNRVFFMENHPPLGKLLIAASEKYFGKNDKLDTSEFLKTDHIKDTPKGFSFSAVRLPSVICAILAAVVLYLSFYEILGNGLISFLATTLLSLDNTILVHSRAAMLEGPQLLLINCALLILCKVLSKNKIHVIHWIAFGLTLGLALSIKLNSAIILIFAAFFVIFNFKKLGLISTILNMISCFCLAGLILFSSYYAHFILARNIVEDKTYGVTQEYKDILIQNDRTFSAFLVSMKNIIEFTDRYNSGVPRLKEDAPKENGSHPIFWPLGKKSISYRWDKTSDGRVKNLKLQCNPVGWFLALAALFAAVSTINAKRFFNVNFEDKNYYTLLEILTLAYVSYMLVMFMMGRVMYLYHYFIPLNFCFVIGVVFLRLKFKDYLNSKTFICSICLLALAQSISFYYFSPFTYHLPVTAEQFQDRSWLNIWRNELILW